MKKTILPFTLLFWLCIMQNAGAQTAQNEGENPFIEVTGIAEEEIVPNEIFVGITLRERIVNKEKLTIETQEEKLKNALKEIGIDVAKNLSVADIYADFIRVRWRKKDVVAQKDYMLKVGDAATLGKVFQKLDEVDILDARITKVNHTKLDSIKRAVKILAIKAAKEKADYLLQAIGEQAGKPLIIKESENLRNPEIVLRNLSGVTISSKTRQPDGWNYSNNSWGGFEQYQAGNDEIAFRK